MSNQNSYTFAERKISEFSDLIETLFSYDLGFVFRGQRDARWPLESSLTRSLKKASNSFAHFPIVEGIIKDILNSRIHHYMLRDEAPKSELGWHAIAQHHGAPTRLVDFTVLPLVALYFATRSLQNEDNPFAIWVLNFRDINDDCESIFTSIKIDEDPDGFFDDCVKNSASSTHQGLWVGEPRKVNLRLERQGGTFLIPTTTNIGLLDLFCEATSRKKIRSDKLVVSSSLLPEIQIYLKKSGITGSRLFDGVDGLASEASDEINRIASSLSQAGTD